MAGRFFFAWRMFAAAKARDERNKSARIGARARASFNPLVHLTETQFRRRYRLPKNIFKLLCSELKQSTNLRSTQRVSLEHKVLTALFFYASGSYQRPVGVAKHVSQKMCSVYIEEVTEALNHRNILMKYIRFPSTPGARQELSQRFYRNYGFPGVVGCIDGSHFKIVVPKKSEEHWYYSRKHYHSLNVQMVCDDQYRILNVNSKFGGANHDSFIWENSDLNAYIQSLHRNGEMVWLLGDSGYPQRPWLMTPIANAAPDTPEANYNEKHMRARVVIENTFSRLKNRWRCLHKDRVLHYKPLKCSRIILACSVLHNIMIDFGVEDREEDILGLELPGTSGGESSQNNYIEREATTDLIRGRILRNQIIRRLQ
ncbi:putative nuclease HARBI1 [Helicoverpa armigera]|uniref:putative nuclease HARBI1 n=1 Tax=Helicoverpa armigera TaxID=29058 RepID=UPI0030827BCA